MSYILGRSKAAFDFDQFIGEVIAAITGTHVTKQNYYADRIARTRNLLAELGMPDACRPFQCLLEVADRQGTCREVEVPLSPGVMVGRIGKNGFLFTGQGSTARSIHDARALIAVIHRQAVIETEAYFDDWGEANHPLPLPCDAAAEGD